MCRFFVRYLIVIQLAETESRRPLSRSGSLHVTLGCPGRVFTISGRSLKVNVAK